MSCLHVVPSEIMYMYIIFQNDAPTLKGLLARSQPWQIANQPVQETDAASDAEKSNLLCCG